METLFCLKLFLRFEIYSEQALPRELFYREEIMNQSKSTQRNQFPWYTLGATGQFRKTCSRLAVAVIAFVTMAIVLGCLDLVFRFQIH